MIIEKGDDAVDSVVDIFNFHEFFEEWEMELLWLCAAGEWLSGQSESLQGRTSVVHLMHVNCKSFLITFGLKQQTWTESGGNKVNEHRNYLAV